MLSVDLGVERAADRYRQLWAADRVVAGLGWRNEIERNETGKLRRLGLAGVAVPDRRERGPGLAVQAPIAVGIDVENNRAVLEQTERDAGTELER